MSNKTIQKSPVLTWVILGALIGAGALLGMLKMGVLGSLTQRDATPEATPIYWVAPMDDAYRRDKPGKSPMGMDLIPVYESTQAGNAPGVIYVSPDIVNNIGVRSQPAQFRQLRHTIDTVGYVKYDEEQLIHVHPRVSGWIDKLFVNATGDPVVKGEPLYNLYSPELVNAQEEYLLALKGGDPRLERAAKNRMRALQFSPKWIKKLTSSKTIDQMVTFYAPQSGVVDNLNVREGYYVQPGTMILSVGGLDDVWIEAEVFERQSHWVTKNNPVEVSLEYLPNKRWQGVVDYIYPALDENNRTLRLRIRLKNSDHSLKPNMFARVTIDTQLGNPVLSIPKTALIRTANATRAVLSMGEGRFKSIDVEVGAMDDQWVEVLSGLNAGDLVVTSSQFLMDSESSKSSDFKRLHHSDQDVESATVVGVINEVDVGSRRVNITRNAIAKWGRPKATLNFIAHTEVKLEVLNSGDWVQFLFEIHGQNFVITRMTVIAQDNAADSKAASGTEAQND